MINRRALLVAISATAFAGSSKALARVPSGGLLQQWLNGHSGASGPVVLPAASTPLEVTGTIKVPSGMNLVIRRDLFGRGKAHLVIGGTTSLRFENARSHNVSLRLLEGQINVRGFNYSGRDHLAAILIDGAGPYRNLLIEHIQVSDANYGILRQGGRSSLSGAIVRHGRFSRLYGDAIEWNVCPHDQDLLIEDHEINGLDDTVGHPNWGIGVGLAGRYDPEWKRSALIKGFVVRNIRGRSLRQLIHVEGGADFKIEQIVGSDISDRFSRQNDIHVALIACYGCTDFLIDDVRSDSGSILICAGAVAGRYIVPSANFTVSNIKMKSGSILTEMGGARSYGRFRNVALLSGAMEMRGAVSSLELTDIEITTPSAHTEPIQSKPSFLSGPLASYRPVAPTEHRIRVRARRGRNYDVTGIYGNTSGTVSSEQPAHPVARQ